MNIHNFIETSQKIDNEMGDVCQVIYAYGQLVQKWNPDPPDFERVLALLLAHK